MHPTINLIMLIDDNDADNFLHARIIRKSGVSRQVIVMKSAIEALTYLQTNDEEHPRPEIIFLDINMPVMNGWDFLEAFKKLEERKPKSRIVAMLSASVNPADVERANALAPGGFRSKPLTVDIVHELADRYVAS